MTTDITTGTATSGPIEPDPQRVQQLDPRTLIMDANVRHDARPNRAMISSVRDHGVLQPIVAVATGDGRARVRFGHRRTLAAIEAEKDTVPVIVHPTDAGADDAAAEIERLSTQTVENTQREGLSATEQLDVFADLAALGLSAGQIAARTKTRRRDVANGIKAARIPEVRDAVASANLTLEQAATLEEFSDDPEAYETLLDRATTPHSWGPGFDHAAQRLRDDRAEVAARAALLADLAAAGTPVIERPPFGGGPTRLVDLTDDPAPDDPAPDDPAPDPSATASGLDSPELDDPEFDDPEVDDPDFDGDLDEDIEGGAGAGPAPITPEAHVACPGHAAYLTTTYGGPKRGPQAVAVHVCTDPLGNGHRSRTGAPLFTPASPAGVARVGETAEQAAERAAAEKAAKSAARKRVIAGNKAWDSATTVRREWLAEMLTRRTPPKGACTWMAQAFLADRYTVCRAAERGHRTGADLLCTVPGATGEPDHDRIAKILAGASEHRATVITLAMVLGAIEGETHRGQWRWVEHRNGRPDASLVRYLEALAGWGYTLSPVERLAIGEDVDDAEVFEAPSIPASTGSSDADSDPDSGDPDGHEDRAAADDQDGPG